MGVAFILMLAACSQGADKGVSNGTTASMEDFKILEGADWTGELDYLNFGSTERSAIPVKLAVTVLNERKLQYATQYPGEESHNVKEVLNSPKTVQDWRGLI